VQPLAGVARELDQACLVLVCLRSALPRADIARSAIYSVIVEGRIAAATDQPA
jgi:hypothetical protein